MTPTPDISTITDALHGLLTDALSDAMSSVPPRVPTFNVSVNRASPETARMTPCQLTLYLLHVARDPHWRNAPVDGPLPQVNAAQPLSLNLYYLLTAWADTFYDQEQQAMTVALQAFHSAPIYRLTNNQGLTQEFTISVEADTFEEMSRLWQAFTVPMRLSCVVKVGVVFVAPLKTPASAKKPPVTANLAVGPIPASGDPPVLFAAMNLRFAPYPPPTGATSGVVTGGELVAVAGSSVLVRGAGLDQADAAQVFLSTPDGLTEWELTAAPSWRPAPTGPIDPATLELVLPAAYSDPVTGAPPPPASAPTPGVYRLAVGRNPGQRSNRIPVTVAARIDSLAGPSGGFYTLAGAGFAPAATRVSVAGIDLTASATVTTSSIIFAPPAVPPPSGTYAVDVVVNGVPCLPGPLVTL